MVSLIVDTDMAFDDWLALLYVSLSPRMALQALTIAATGEAHGDRGAKTAHRLLRLVGRSDCPVAVGKAKPFSGGHQFPLVVRWVMDLRLGLRLPTSSKTVDRRSAWKLLAEKIEQAPHPVTILALGPLTNLAQLCLQRPELVASIERMYVMGGALHVPGNLREILPKTKNTFAEWNVYIDPAAFNTVLQSAIPMTLIPLDATNQAPVTQAMLADWATSVRTPAADFALRVLRRMLFLAQRSPSGVYLWDVVAAVLIDNPTFATLATHSISVTTAPEWQSGHVKIDAAGAPVQVVERINAKQFSAAFWQTLNGQAPTEA